MKNPPSVLVTLGIISIFHTIVDPRRGLLAEGRDHYCSRDPSHPVQEIKGEAEGDIYTLYPGDSHYQDNQNCVWMIDAGVHSRVEITVVSSKLQWAHKSVICPGHDHVAIKNVPRNESIGTGAESGESILVQWCGYALPLGAVSSGRYIRVEFMSDKQNPYEYAGVHLRFKTFPSNECAPTWRGGNSSGEFCYKLLEKVTDWSSAQKECNTGGANLASVLSRSEQDFLFKTFGSSSSSATAWIGLNDIVYPGDYQWIDTSPYHYNRFGPSHTPNEYFRCVAMDLADGFWKLQSCEKGMSKPLCKSKRGAKPVLFPIPQRRPDETDPATPVGRISAIAISVFVLVTLILIGCILYRKLKAARQNSAYQAPKRPTRQNVPLHEIASVNPHPRPTAPPDEQGEESVMTTPDFRMLAPPTYEEALCHPIVPSPRT